MNESNKVKKMVTIAMLSSIAYVLMLFQFPLPGLPPFLQVDFSDIPALIGGIIFGPVTGVVIVLFKNILHALISGTSTLGIGETANFLAGALYIVPVVYMYRKYHSMKALSVGLAAGTVVMTLGMGVLNYFVFLPAYAAFLNYELPNSIILAGIVPFNLIKGLMVSGVFMLLFQNIKVWMSRRISTKKIVETANK